MTRQTLSGVRTRVKRLASRLPKPKPLTPEMLRRLSDEELDRLLLEALAAMPLDDPLRSKLATSLDTSSTRLKETNHVEQENSTI